jgi:hypothetical protein
MRIAHQDTRGLSLGSLFRAEPHFGSVQIHPPGFRLPIPLEERVECDSTILVAGHT